MLREHLKKRRGEGRRSGEQQYPIFCFAQEKRSGINAEERERGSLLPASPSPGPMLLFAKLHNPLVPKQGWVVSTILRATGRERERDDMERKIVLQYLGFGVQRRVVVVRQTRRSRDSNPSRASKSSSLTLSSHTGRSVKVENKRKKKKGLRTE